MPKITLLQLLIFIFIPINEIVLTETMAATAFPLSKQNNGIDGTLEISTINSETSKIRILNTEKKEVESQLLKGRDGRLDRINGSWPNGPLYLATMDLGIGMGSYNGPYSQTFQVSQGRIQWANIHRSQNKNFEPIRLPKTAKTEWRARKMANSSEVEILEISCSPDFDRNPDAADEMKFKKTFTRYRFNGHKWRHWSRIEEGCWETGDKFPGRGAFP